MKNLESILEEFISSKQMTVYHSTMNGKLLDLLKLDDYTPGIFGAGNMHGKGFYTVWKKEDLRNYGDSNYKGVVNLSGLKILILDPAFYKEINKPIPVSFVKEQLQSVGAISSEKENQELEKEGKEIEKYNLPRFIDNKIMYKGQYINPKNFFTSSLLSYLEKRINGLSKYFDGVAYRGERDGHCLLMWNYRNIKMFGKYDKKNDKLEIDAKSFRKQKNNQISNNRIYSKNGTIIKEKNGNYIFIFNNKEILHFSREQKNVESLIQLNKVFSDLKEIKKFAKKHKIPKEILNSLTFTNGKKINNVKSIKKTVKSRNNIKLEKTVKDIVSDYTKGTLIKNINYYLKNIEDDDSIEYLILVEKAINEKFLSLDQISGGGKIITSCFPELPYTLSRGKNVEIDLKNKRLFRALDTTSGFRYYNSKDFSYFNGMFINVPKVLLIDVEDVGMFLRNKKIVFNNPSFNDCLVLINGFSYDERFDPTTPKRGPGSSRKEEFSRTNLFKSLDSKNKLINCYLYNLNPDNNFEILPPSIFDNKYISKKTNPFTGKKENKIFIHSKVSSIEFGKSNKSWVFPKQIKEIVFYPKLSKKSLEELKKRNPTIKFIEGK